MHAFLMKKILRKKNVLTFLNTLTCFMIFHGIECIVLK